MRTAVADPCIHVFFVMMIALQLVSRVARLPSLPPKTWWRSLDPNFVAQRCKELDRYLKVPPSNPPRQWPCDDALTPHENTLTATTSRRPHSQPMNIQNVYIHTHTTCTLYIYISHSLSIIKESGLDYQITAMGTIVEGEASEVFNLIQACHTKMTNLSGRVSTSIKIDDRAGATGRLRGKVNSVEKVLGEELNK